MLILLWIKVTNINIISGLPTSIDFVAYSERNQKLYQTHENNKEVIRRLYLRTCNLEFA